MCHFYRTFEQPLKMKYISVLKQSLSHSVSIEGLILTSYRGVCRAIICGDDSLLVSRNKKATEMTRLLFYSDRKV